MATLPETTLANPLLDAAYSQFLEMYTGIRPPDRTELGRLTRTLLTHPSAPGSDVLKRHVPTDTPLLSTLGDKVIPEEVAQVYLQEVGFLCVEQWESIQRELAALAPSGAPPLPLLPLEALARDTPLVNHFRRALFWLNVVDHVVQASRQGGWVRWEGGWYSRRLCLVPWSGTYHLLTLDACLMFKDMMYSRFIMHLYCRLDPSRSHLAGYLDQYVQWGREVLLQLGNDGYEVLKGIESLTQTALIAREETVLDGARQHQSMISKYREKELKVGGNGSLITALDLYLRSFASSRDLAEAFGFLKLWGHPYVDPIAGCVSAKTLAQQPLHLKLTDCLKLEWSFCHIYCRGYLKKNGQWPKLIFTPRPDGTPTKLQGLCDKGQPALAFGFTQYPASDWMWTQFAPHVPFHEGEDILSLVVDKSLSYDRDHLDYTWGARLPYRPPKPPTSSRVMEELITRTSIDLPSIVERVARRDIPHLWKIVTVCPKEREMKKEPRMFSMMVLEMRLFFVLTEHNIAEGIFKNLPEQTMTLSRSELLELFLQSTRPTPGSWVRAVLGIDFSRWNLQWRKETVHPIGSRMDQIYGKPGVFSVVHDFFEESVCLLRLPDYPPDFLDKSNRHQPPEGRTLWYNHKGGFEGIAQKLWTSCTIALIHMSLWHLGLSYRIIGQGDNQVCILDCYVPRSLNASEAQEYIRSLVDQATTSIAEVSRTVGQIVKPEECIYSTCFLTYGKEMILRGAYLPTALKYVSRMFPSTTGDAPSLYEMLSSISSGASGATERNDWTFPTYFLAKMMEGITLSREMKRSLFHGIRVKEEVALLTGAHSPLSPRPDLRLDLLRLALAVPANLGGFPITTIPEMLYRGHSDPLSSSLLHLSLLSGIPSVDDYKRVLWKGWLFDPNPQIQGLIQDPYSLPLRGVSPPASRVAVATSELLPSVTHNTQFRELLDRASPSDKENLCSWLATFRPLYPKMVHDLYKSSLVGLRDAFARRFTNTRTILSISRRAGLSITDVSLSSDFSFLRQVLTNFHLTWKVGSASPSFGREENYRVACTLRKAWLKGLPLEGVTTAHPLAIGSIQWIPLGGPVPPPPPCLVALAFSTPSEAALASRGPVDPYLGSVTSDKSVAKWVRPIDTSPPLMDVLKILSIRALVALPDTLLWEGLTQLAQSRSALPVETLRELVKLRVGGTLAHRYQTRDDSRGSFWNSCFNWPSHITYSTNLAGDLGSRDYPYDFQEAMLSMTSLACWYYSQTFTPPPWGLCLTAQLELMDEVCDHVVDSASYPLIHLPPPHNYYASVLQVLVSSSASTAARFLTGELRLPWERADSPLVHALSTIFLYHFRGRLAVTTRYGHTIGLASHRRVVDLPEAGLLPTSIVLEALSRALWYKVGLPLALLCGKGARKPTRLLTSLLDLEVRRGVPGLAGTLREVEGGQPLYGLGIGLGRENESAALARWMSLCLERTPSCVIGKEFYLYERGSSSISSLLSSTLGVVAARECLAGDPVRFKAGKLLARVVKKCLEAADEQDRVRLLASVIQVTRLSSLYRVSPSSPEETLRLLREGAPLTGSEPQGGRVRRIYRPPQVRGLVEGGTARLQLPLRPLPPLCLLSSWQRRLVEVPSAAERWAPIGTLHPLARKVLLVGVGDGGIGGALPHTWSVVGVELGSALQSLGHSFTTYRPPGLSNQFAMHPLSWTLGGDITHSLVQETLRHEATKGKYDLILLDVEGVSNTQRLEARSFLAGSGVPTYCKVLVDEADSALLLQSWAAYRSPSDQLWTTHSYPGLEFIVGSSDAPLGVYAAVPTPDPVPILVPAPEAHEYRVSSYPLYTPGPDLILLTGHLPPLTRLLIRPLQCRALYPYLSPPFAWDSKDRGWDDLLLHLLVSGCPRRRIRALIRLRDRGLLSSDFVERAGAL